MNSQDTDDAAFFAGIGIAVLAAPFLFGIIILAAMWRAWWLFPAWGWYIQPLGAPAISFWHFAALLIFVSTLTHHPRTKKDDRKENPNAWVGALLGTPITWILLWWFGQ